MWWWMYGDVCTVRREEHGAVVNREREKPDLEAQRAYPLDAASVATIPAENTQPEMSRFY